MATHPLSTVIGVFPDHDQADSAIDALRHTGFGYDRIRLVERGTGSFVDTLKGMFTGQASTTSSTADSLVKMGMPDYEAQHYQGELDANHVLLLMNADDRPEEAFSIMRQNGAFDINSRLRIASENGFADADTSNGARETLRPDMPAAAASYPNGVSSTPDSAMSPAAPYADRSEETTDPDRQPVAVAPNVAASSTEYSGSSATPDAVAPSSAPDLEERPETSASNW